MPSYSFTYLDGDGAVVQTFDAECAGHDEAIAHGVRSKPRDAAVVEVVCGERVAAKRRLDADAM